MTTITRKGGSDKYAQEIRAIIKKFKNKNKRQPALKQITHRLDVFQVAARGTPKSMLSFDS